MGAARHSGSRQARRRRGAPILDAVLILIVPDVSRAAASPAAAARGTPRHAAEEAGAVSATLCEGRLHGRRGELGVGRRAAARTARTARWPSYGGRRRARRAHKRDSASHEQSVARLSSSATPWCPPSLFDLSRRRTARRPQTLLVVESGRLRDATGVATATASATASGRRGPTGWGKWPFKIINGKSRVPRCAWGRGRGFIRETEGNNKQRHANQRVAADLVGWMRRRGLAWQRGADAVRVECRAATPRPAAPRSPRSPRSQADTPAGRHISYDNRTAARITRPPCPRCSPCR